MFFRLYMRHHSSKLSLLSAPVAPKAARAEGDIVQLETVVLLDLSSFGPELFFAFLPLKLHQLEDPFNLDP